MSVMDWSNEEILEFLDLFQKEPSIWNQWHKNHKDRTKVNDAWERIKNNFSLDVPIFEIKNKKNSLMATYRKLYGKLLKTGKGNRWFAFDKMHSFLYFIYKPRDAAEMPQIDNGSNSGEPDNNKEPTIKLEKSNEDPFVSTSTNNRKSCKSNETVKRADEASSSVPAKKQKTSKSNEIEQRMDEPSQTDSANNKSNEIEARVNEAYKLLKDFTKQSPQDEISLYVELLDKKLRALDEHTREIAMFEINNIMFNLKQQQSSHPQTYSPHLYLDPVDPLQSTAKYPLSQSPHLKQSPTHSTSSRASQSSYHKQQSRSNLSSPLESSVSSSSPSPPSQSQQTSNLSSPNSHRQPSLSPEEEIY